MRRSILFLIAATVLAAISCTKEIDNQITSEKELVAMSFDATLGVPTKTEIGEANGEGGYKVLWSKDDKITVISNDEARTDYDNGVQFTTDIESASASATFTGQAEAADSYYALYPYNANHRWYYDNDKFSAVFNVDQVAGNLENGLAVAKAENGVFNFKHVCGYIKFEIPSDLTDVKKVSFAGKAGETLGGKYVYVDMAASPMHSVSSSNTVQTLTLSPASGDVFTPGIYYIAALPADLESGFTLTFTASDDKVAKKETDKPAAIEAGHILNLGNITGLTFEEPEPESIAKVTVAEFLAKTPSADVWYELTGVVSSIANTYYGNFTLVDETGSVYVYGLTTTKVTENDKSFSQIGLKEGDVVTLIGIRKDYYGTPQVDGPAYYVSHLSAAAAPVIDCTENVVTIEAETGATIYYTTDGEDPTTSSYVYGEPIQLEEGDDFTIKAIAVVAGKPQSVVSSRNCVWDDPNDVEIPTEESTITFTTDKAQRTEYSTTQQVWENEGVVFTNAKANSTTDVGDYSNPVRLYQGSSVTVSAPGKITEIVFVSNGTAKYKTALENSLKGAGVTPEISGNNYTVTFATPVDSFTFSLTAQGRLNSMTVTYQSEEQ